MDYDNSKIEGCPLIVINDDLVSTFCGKIKFFPHKRQIVKNSTTSGLLFLVNFEIFEQTLTTMGKICGQMTNGDTEKIKKADKLCRQIRHY